MVDISTGINYGKNIITTATKNLALAMTFGAYHAYIIDQEFNRQQNIRHLEEDIRKINILNEIKEIREIRDEINKKRWLF